MEVGQSGVLINIKTTCYNSWLGRTRLRVWFWGVTHCQPRAILVVMMFELDYAERWEYEYPL